MVRNVNAEEVRKTAPFPYNRVHPKRSLYRCAIDDEGAWKRHPFTLQEGVSWKWVSEVATTLSGTGVTWNHHI
jgi:hypothetical protein